MKINIIEEKKDLLVIELEGVKHTLPNLLRNVLWEDKDVDYTAYEKKHPYLGHPRLVIKGKDPKKSLEKAVKSSKDLFKNLKAEFSKAK